MQSITFYSRRIGVRVLHCVCRLIPDKMYLKSKYRICMGKKLNLEHPKTFSEKLQWLKLHDRKPEYTVMVDKVKAKEYVASILGDEYIIPTLGVWDDPDKIDFDSLPDRFVLKCNHNSGLGMYICKDKNKIDLKKIKSELKKGLRQNYYIYGREWPYKDVPRRILAEQYIDPAPGTNDLPDYKFFCFNGEPKYCQVISGRNEKMCIDFFDYEWKHQPFHEPREYPFADIEPTKPKHYEQMWAAARQLAQNKPFSRIDFYDTNEHVYFGEITFFPTGGLGGFEPTGWDEKFGDLIVLLTSNEG